MQAARPSGKRKLGDRFRSALRGVQRGLRGEKNFIVHVAFAVAVLVVAGILRARLWEWAVLVLCIGSVLAAEMFNTAMENAAKAITNEHNESVRNALDIASAAVLIAAVAASVVGVLILGHRLGLLLGWWLN